MLERGGGSAVDGAVLRVARPFFTLAKLAGGFDCIAFSVTRAGATGGRNRFEVLKVMLVLVVLGITARVDTICVTTTIRLSIFAMRFH